MKKLIKTSLIPLILLLLQLQIFSQLPICENGNLSFAVTPISPVCGSEEVSEISFSISNLTSDVGDYAVTFPDGNTVPFLDIQNSVNVVYELAFPCNALPGDPIPPNEFTPYFQYAIIVSRTDCVDEDGNPFSVTAALNVTPNPVEPFAFTNTDCITAPYVVSFDGNVCNSNLVSFYEWFIDNVSVGNSLNLDDYTFGVPGNYEVTFQVETYTQTCLTYEYTQIITITAAPQIAINLDIDSTQLCQETIIINPINNSSLTDSQTWTSSNPNVTFSDPTAAEPTITITNNAPGTYNFTLTAQNAECGEESQNFSVETSAGQDISIIPDIITCSNVAINLCDLIEYEGIPSFISWAAMNPNVSISDPDTECPEVTFTASGTYTLTAAGEDVCENSFSINTTFEVTGSQPVLIDLSEVDTLCGTDMSSINILNYVNPADYIVSVTGDGLTDNFFTPFGNEGLNLIILEDSCGTFHETEIFVTTPGSFNGDNPEICTGEILDLVAIQAGIYSGNAAIIDGIFYSDIAGVGTHDITYTSPSTEECAGTSTFTITVIELPVADFIISNESCQENTAVYPVNEILNLNNNSSSNVICYEVLETGETSCNGNSANFTFPDAGEYTIQQIVGTASQTCFDTITQTIFIEASLSVMPLVVVDTTNCDSISLMLSSGSSSEPAYTYTWTTESGLTLNVAEGELTIPRPFIEDNYAITLQVNTFCDTIEETVEVLLPARFQASFDILNLNDTICSGSYAYFVNTSTSYDSLSVAYGEDFTSSVFLDSLDFFNDSDTIQQIEITVTAFKVDCPPQIFSDTLVLLPVNVEAIFSLDTGVDNCMPALVSLQNSSTPGSYSLVFWEAGASPQQVGSLETAEHTFNFPNDTTITIMMISSLCGQDTFYQDLEFFASPEIDFSTVRIGGECTNDTVQLFITPQIEPNVSIDWDFGDGVFSDFPNPTHIYQIAGEFSVTLSAENSNLCKSEVTQNLEIFGYTGEDFAFDFPNAICQEESLEFTNSTPNLTVNLDNGNIIFNPDSLYYPEAGEFFPIVTITDDNGCTRDTTFKLNVIAPLEVRMFPVDTVYDLGDTIHLSFVTFPNRNLISTEWTGESIDNDSVAITFATPINDGYYELKVVDEYGCPAVDKSYIDLIHNLSGLVYIPNAFSPDGNGRNDKFCIFAKENTVDRIISLKIYTRWGERVFENFNFQPNDREEGWDGIFRKKLQPGVFVWTTEILFLDGTKKTLKGDVSLIK